MTHPPFVSRQFRRLLAGTMALAAALLPGQEPLRVLYAERAPYMSRSGEEVGGLTADVATYALRKAGIPFRWEEVPSARQLFMIQENKEPLAGLGWFRNSERDKFAKFSSPLYQDKQIAVLSRRDNMRVALAGSLDRLLGNRSLILLAKVAYSYGPFLDERIARFHPPTSKVTVENLNMIRIIHAKRADYMFIAPEEAEAAIRRSDVPANDLSLAILPDMPAGEKRYLMFSTKVDDETITRINHFIDEYNAARKHVSP